MLIDTFITWSLATLVASCVCLVVCAVAFVGGLALQTGLSMIGCDLKGYIAWIGIHGPLLAIPAFVAGLVIGLCLFK